jgi:chemotaxis protein MotB
LSITPPETIIFENDNKSDETGKTKNETDELIKMQKDLQSHFEELKMTDNISTFVDSRGLIVSVNNSILLDPGKADLKPEIEQILMQIGIFVNKYDNFIRVEGHTDNVPVNIEHFPSNWELSTARASRVVRFLADECGITPERLSAVGYGEFKPLDSNQTAEGRAHNRRVDIIILSSKYNDLEIAPYTIPEGGWGNESP